MRRDADELQEGWPIDARPQAFAVLQLAPDLAALSVIPEASKTAVSEQQSCGEKQ
jgi:hypothetical protein